MTQAHTDIGLNAAIVAVTEETPRILTVRSAAMPPMEHPESLGNWADSHYALPFGPFEAEPHRTLDSGLRSWVEEQTGLTLRYVEQLYTFADRLSRHARARWRTAPGVGRLYRAGARGAARRNRRGGVARLVRATSRGRTGATAVPALIERTIRPQLDAWVERRPTTAGARAAASASRWRSAPACDLGFRAHARALRAAVRGRARGRGGARPDDRRGACRPGGPAERSTATRTRAPRCSARRWRSTTGASSRPRSAACAASCDTARWCSSCCRRIFTLLQLQRVVEALSGVRLHKQNFRRLVITGELVESHRRREVTARAAGRPSCSASARKCCASAPPPASASRPARVGTVANTPSHVRVLPPNRVLTRSSALCEH